VSNESDIAQLAWKKAAASGATGCIEVARLATGGVAIRDSKNSSGAVLAFTLHEWESFLDGLRKGEFDHLMEATSGGQ
jgi:hypothetical protein